MFMHQAVKTYIMTWATVCTFVYGTGSDLHRSVNIDLFENSFSVSAVCVDLCFSHGQQGRQYQQLRQVKHHQIDAM